MTLPLEIEMASVKTDEFEVKVEHDFGALVDQREAWNALAAEAGSNIYMSYDWSRTWWEFYGTGKQLRLFLFYSGAELVGIVPLYIERTGLKPLQLSVARLVCANIPPKAFHPPIQPAWAERVFEAILKQLFEKDCCDIFSFGPVSEEHNLASALEKAAKSNSRLVSRTDVVSEGVQSVFHLPKTMDEYFEAMDKDERKKRKYELRQLRKEPTITEDVLSDARQVEQEFENFARLHALQWKDKGKLGHFGSWPRGLEFNRALVKALGRAGQVRFVRVLAGTEVISSQYAFSFGNACFWELPARALDPKWRRFSLGPAGFFAVVDAAIKEGKTRVEGGLAHYDYKQKLNATEYPTRIIRLRGAGLGRRMRTGLFLTLRFCLLWGYFKIWYARLSPRLPDRFRRSLWPFWLRLDF